jgi:hypothetical protein
MRRFQSTSDEAVEGRALLDRTAPWPQTAVRRVRALSAPWTGGGTASRIAVRILSHPVDIANEQAPRTQQGAEARRG